MWLPETGHSPVICPEYNLLTGVCGLKQVALDAGILSVLLTAVTQQPVGDRGVDCGLAKTRPETIE